MKVIYNIVNLYIGSITINVHDNICYGSQEKPAQDCRGNFAPFFVWNNNESLIEELQERLLQSERDKQELNNELIRKNQQEFNQETDSL